VGDINDESEVSYPGARARVGIRCKLTCMGQIE